LYSPGQTATIQRIIESKKIREPYQIGIFEEHHLLDTTEKIKDEETGEIINKNSHLHDKAQQFL
jgi:hypothetical protein